MIASREIDVNVMVTHHFPFARTQEGFDMVADYRDGVVKAMIEFPQEDNAEENEEAARGKV